MTIASRTIHLVLILSFLPILWSCAQMKDCVSKTLPSAPPAPSGTEQKPVPPEKEGSCVTGLQRPPIPPSTQAADQAKTWMNSGNFQKAFDVYRIAHKERPGDKKLLNQYVKCIEQFKSAADASLDCEEVIDAGRRYLLLTDNYPDFDSFKAALSFTDIDLDEKFSISKRTIAKQGFEEYRKGNLEAAISLWQELLEIEPDNTDIKEVLNTATLQWKNLNE